METPQRFHGGADMILLTGGHPARGQDKAVTGGGPGQRLGNDGFVIGKNPQIRYHAAQPLKQGEQAIAVGVVERARGQFFAGLAYLITTGKHRHRQGFVDGKPGQA